MKEQWKEELADLIENNLWGLVCSNCGGGGMFDDTTCSNCKGTGITDWNISPLISKFENLIEEQKKDLSNRRMYEQGRKELIEQILKDAPEDMNTDDIMEHLFQTRSSYNACNAQWRKLLNNFNSN